MSTEHRRRRGLTSRTCRTGASKKGVRHRRGRAHDLGCGRAEAGRRPRACRNGAPGLDRTGRGHVRLRRAGRDGSGAARRHHRVAGGAEGTPGAVRAHLRADQGHRRVRRVPVRRDRPAGEAGHPVAAGAVSSGVLAGTAGRACPALPLPPAVRPHVGPDALRRGDRGGRRRHPDPPEPRAHGEPRRGPTQAHPRRGPAGGREPGGNDAAGFAAPTCGSGRP